MAFRVDNFLRNIQALEYYQNCLSNGISSVKDASHPNLWKLGKELYEPANKQDKKVFLYKKPIGCMRIIEKGKRARFGRLAVLSEYRGKGIAQKILNFVINYYKENDFDEIYFHSQDYIKKLLENRGMLEDEE